MALPKFNDNPLYQLTIPSNKKFVKFRPFLVKEQKVLLIAFESKDEGQILEAIGSCIESCIQDKIDVKNLTTFDIEYIFMQIRSKSVGEKAELIFKCPTCDESCETQVDLENISVSLPEKTSTVKINEKYTIQLKYPVYSDIVKEYRMNKSGNTLSDVDKLYFLIKTCMDSLLTEDERIPFKDETQEEIDEFLDSLGTDSFNKILEFTQNIPSLEVDAEYTCKKCNENHTRKLKGMTDFFMYASPTRL
jgi:ribosomal protein L44E